jgi:hypothetical protein
MGNKKLQNPESVALGSLFHQEIFVYEKVAYVHYIL